MSANFREALGDPSSTMNQYDAAPAGDILAQFDAASGKTHIPAGEYICEIADGRLTKTKNDKDCYSLACRVSEGPHGGHRVYRKHMLDTPDAINRTKAVLAKLGLTNGAALRRSFPEPGRVITVRAVVTVSEWNGEKRNNIERFEVIDDRTAPPNPNAIDLSTYAAPAPSTPLPAVTTPVLAAPVPEPTIPRMVVPSLEALGPRRPPQMKLRRSSPSPPPKRRNRRRPRLRCPAPAADPGSPKNRGRPR